MTGLGELGPLFEQHKVAVLGTAAAGVVALALHRRKTGGTTAAAAAPAAQSASAGGQVAAMSGGYDSTASDLYGAIQPQLESLAHQLNNVPVSAPPIASQITAPTNSGKYVVLPGNVHAELESDGSLFHLSPQMIGGIIANNNQKNINWQQLGTPLSWYEASNNLQAKQANGTPVTFTKQGATNATIVSSDGKTQWRA